MINEDALWYRRGDLVEFKLTLAGGPKTCRGLVLNTGVLFGRGARQLWILDIDGATPEQVAQWTNKKHLVHEEDIIATIPKLLEAASVPATTVNWCGEQTVSLQDWCRYLGSLVGKEPVFEESPQALRGNPTDVSAMRELIGGGTTVDWQDGMRRLAATFHPDLVG